MKKSCARVLTRILAALLLCASAASAASCGQAKTTAEVTTASTDQTEEETTGETTEERLTANLPDDLTLDGMEVRVMMHPVGGTDWQDWASRDIYAESMNGEVINDAVYTRNLTAEEKLNCSIKGIEVSDEAATAKKVVLGGTDDYHLCTPRIESIKQLVREGYFVDLYDLQYIDLTKPWYDQMMVQNGTILGQLYYVTGDMIILDDDSTSAMVFNKAMISSYNMDSPYDLVANNGWTFDKMNEMITAAAKDLNGDGVMDLTDQYGLIWQRDAIVSYLHAGGGRLVTIDSTGTPQITLGDERNYGIMQKIFDIMYRDDVVINLHHYEGKQDIYQLQTKMFSEDRCLMMWIRMRVVETLRNMQSDFGIIPMPKYEDTQDSYYHTVNRYTGAAIAIPNSGMIDAQKIGALVEELSAESRYTLRDAYYNVNLGEKISRDPESTQMLDIIMNTRVYDTGELYDIGGLSWDLYALTMSNKGDFASFMTKHEAKAEKQLAKFIEDFQKLKDAKSAG